MTASEAGLKLAIRSLTGADISEAVALQSIPWPGSGQAQKADEEMRAGLIDAPGTYGTRFIVAASEEGEIVGMSGWNLSNFASATYGLCWAVVHPNWRKRGVNAAMLDARLARIAEYNSAPAYDVMVRTWDNPLYRSRGFVAGFQEIMDHPEGKNIMLAHFNLAGSQTRAKSGG